MTTLLAVRDDIDHWFFSGYFQDFIAIGAGKADPNQILAYWGVPIHMANPAHAKWITSSDGVVRFLQDMQAVLKQAGYTHTEVVDKKTTIYSETAGRVETIMSRRRADGSEIDRAAISFEIRRADQSWIIISTAARPTALSALRDVW
jgi:hypothetical protein